MITVDLFAAPSRVLCVGAHPDDIEIGAGASLRVLQRVNPGVEIRWLVLTADELRSAEAVDSAQRYLGDGSLLTLYSFRDGHLPYDDPAAVKAAMFAHRADFVPDLVIAPSPSDAHQDHRFVGELVWQAYRNQVVMHYEIVKYEGDLGAANLYVPVSAEDVRRKLEDLRGAFPSQAVKPWFDDELFTGLMRIRGVEANSETGYAEAFVAPKLVLRSLG